MHRLAQHTGLVEAIDQHLHVLKVALPYHKSDHVLGIAYNVLCGGTCLQDIERLRQDEVYLDALGAQRIPDPTTAGDFCRRFDASAIEALQAAINETRVRVWRAQPAAFSTRRSSTRTARWPRRRASAKQGWISRIAACGAITRSSCRWRTPRSPCG
jgi:hypothetical protein